jgi:hypothetical protein
MFTNRTFQKIGGDSFPFLKRYQNQSAIANFITSIQMSASRLRPCTLHELEEVTSRLSVRVQVVVKRPRPQLAIQRSGLTSSTTDTRVASCGVKSCGVRSCSQALSDAWSAGGGSHHIPAAVALLRIARQGSQRRQSLLSGDVDQRIGGVHPTLHARDERLVPEIDLPAQVVPDRCRPLVDKGVAGSGLAVKHVPT